jgi:HK97 gp10 family phage protein
MPGNVSVQRFIKLTADLKLRVHADAVNELRDQAAALAQTIEQVAPVYQGPPEAGVQPGALKHSVRVVPDRSKDTIVRVVAGGQQTIRPSVSSTPYDYARADEFGTQKMRAHPFFFPTYRLMKKRIIAGMRRRITADIKQVSANE